MKYRITLLFVLLSFPLLLSAQNDNSNDLVTLILLRHAETAENDPRDPDLSAAGQERAKSLINLLSDIEVDEFYSTAYKRTRQTIESLVTQRGKVIKEYDPRGENFVSFAEELRKMHGKTVLVAGHSNTTPMLANLLLKEERFQQLNHSEFGKLWIITLSKDGAKKALVLNY